MKCFMMTIVLTFVLSVSALAGDVPIVPGPPPAPGDGTTTSVPAPGDIPTDGSAISSLSLEIGQTLLGLAF